MDVEGVLSSGWAPDPATIVWCLGVVSEAEVMAGLIEDVRSLSTSGRLAHTLPDVDDPIWGALASSALENVLALAHRAVLDAQP